MKENKTRAEIRKKILDGLNLSLKRLVLEASRENRELVIVIDGKPVWVKATELLEQVNLSK